MKIFWAIVVSAIIVFVSALLFSILKISMGSGASFIGLIIIIIGIWLIKYSWTKITYSEEPKESIIDNTQSLAKAVINHSKEFVQEVKPTINNYIEKHNEIVIKNDFKIENNMISENINEDEIYEQVMLEIEKDTKVKSTWAKALSQSDGDKNRAESIYIKLRVDFLVQEKKEQIELERKKIEEQELLIKQEQDRLEQEKIEEERIEQKKIEEEEKEQKRLEQEKIDKFMKKAFIGIIIVSISYFSYDQLTDIYSVEKQLKNGDKYYLKTDKQDYSKAFKWYEKAANQGNSDAQSKLGKMYIQGQGVTQDYKEAFKWFEKSYEKAAIQGNAEAQGALGRFYQNLKGDSKQALIWFEKSANQGNSDSQYELGKIYYYGFGINQNNQEAFQWFEKSANQGGYLSLYYLGKMYRNGEGVETNKYKAFELLLKTSQKYNHITFITEELNDLCKESPSVCNNYEISNSKTDFSADNLFIICSGCHGEKGEKSALEKSKIIAGWDKQKLINSLQGYKNGSYGGEMKDVMRNQLLYISNSEIEALAEFISKL